MFSIIYSISCTDEQLIEKTLGYESIGIEHNLALDSVLHILQEKKISGVRLTTTEVLSSTNNYFRGTKNKSLQVA